MLWLKLPGSHDNLKSLWIVWGLMTEAKWEQTRWYKKPTPTKSLRHLINIWARCAYIHLISSCFGLVCLALCYCHWLGWAVEIPAAKLGASHSTTVPSSVFCSFYLGITDRILGENGMEADLVVYYWYMCRPDNLLAKAGSQTGICPIILSKKKNPLNRSARFCYQPGQKLSLMVKPFRTKCLTRSTLPFSRKQFFYPFFMFSSFKIYCFALLFAPMFIRGVQNTNAVKHCGKDAYNMDLPNFLNHDSQFGSY